VVVVVLVQYIFVYYRALTSDLKILISDISTVPANTLSALFTPTNSVSLPDIVTHLLHLNDSTHAWSGEATRAFAPSDTIVLLNKTDLIGFSGHVRHQPPAENGETQASIHCAHVSCKTGEGIGDFMSALGEMLKSMCVITVM